MIMIDLNGLKQANDDCGHDPGNSPSRARAASKGGAADAFGRAMSELRSLFGSPLASASSPGLVRLDRHTLDRWRFSHALPMHTDTRLKLATPFEDRIFFGGEATHPTDFFTAHGALESATRTAREVLKALIPELRPAKSPVPLSSRSITVHSFSTRPKFPQWVHRRRYHAKTQRSTRDGHSRSVELAGHRHAPEEKAFENCR
jgi:hypothetical protein